MLSNTKQNETYTSRSAADLQLSELQTRIQRLRLRLDEFFYKPEMIYFIHFAFSESDMNSDVSREPYNAIPWELQNTSKGTDEKSSLILTYTHDHYKRKDG